MKKFTEKELKAIKAAVAQAEKKTTGEIVPLIADQADAYLGGMVLFCVITLMIFTGAYLSLEHWRSVTGLVWGQALTVFLSLVILKFFPRVKLLFTAPAQIQKTIYDKALQEFYQHGVSKTKEHTGILLALFLMERKVQVIADEGIHKRCNQKTWDGVVSLIISGAKQKKVTEGFSNGIMRCGEILAREFPANKINKNELGDELIIDQ